MTQKEIRAQIYDYIYDNILPKEHDQKLWMKQRADIKKLLQQFASVTIPEPPKQPEAPKRPRFDREWDKKNGIWRADEFYR